MESNGNIAKRQSRLDFFINKKPRLDNTTEGTTELKEGTSDIVPLDEEINVSANVTFDQPFMDQGQQDLGFDISKTKHEAPIRPILKAYPANEKNRRFSSFYFTIHDWIEYSCMRNAVYCYACRHFASLSLFKGEKEGGRAFIDVGFTKWKDMKALFAQHADSSRHKSAMVSWVDWRSIASKEAHSNASLLSASRSSEVAENRSHIKTLLRATGFLGRQGWAFRGHDESDNSDNRGNFIEFLDVLVDTDACLKSRMEHHYGHYMSVEYQNDLIRVIGEKIEKTIAHEILAAEFFAILVDETKDISKKEQLSIIIRYFHAECVKERVIGTYHMKALDAESLSNFIYQKVVSIGLNWNNCVAQCYDGASVMSGWATGVQARIRENAPNAVYIHCYAHRLNLVLVNTINNIIELHDFFSTVATLYNFIANSNTRHELFVEVQKKLEYKKVLQLERTAPTRWLYWYRSIKKIQIRYQAVLTVLEAVIIDNCDASPEAIGLKRQLQSTSFIIFLHILEKLLCIINSLSEQLQEKGVVIFHSQHLIKGARTDLFNARSPEEWESLKKHCYCICFSS